MSNAFPYLFRIRYNEQGYSLSRITANKFHVFVFIRIFLTFFLNCLVSTYLKSVCRVL